MRLPILLIVVIVFLCPSVARSGGKVAMQLHDSRAVIRAELLKYTPMGSSAATVLAFINNRLQHKGAVDSSIANLPAGGPATEGSHKKGIRHIKILLGECLSSPLLLTMDVPIPILTEVSVQWAFDEKERLIEIFVERKAEGP